MLGQLQTIAEGAAVPPGSGLEAWAAALALDRRSDHVVRLPGWSAEPDPILSVDGDGVVRAGRYAGVLQLDGEGLLVMPTMDSDELAQWVRAAVGLLEIKAAVRDQDVAPLLGPIWGHAVDDASRHGPPAFREAVAHEGATVRGHLDVRRTVRLRAKGETRVASVYRTRVLDNPVTRAIVAADNVLVRQIGHKLWWTDRLQDILPQLHAAVGRRVALPGDRELGRVRYSPITRPFKWAAELSVRIVRQDPVATVPRPGRVQGLVIDVADVQRHAVMEWARAGRPDLRFEIAGPDTLVAVTAGGRRGRLAVGDLPTAPREAAASIRQAVEDLEH